MTVDKKITERFPRNGSLPDEQTAENAVNGIGVEAISGMTESDKMIYQLVQNNVVYAGEQFGENLRFSSQTLTNVLYDNIYRLLGEKVGEDEFVNWVAEELVKNGAVSKTEAKKETQDTGDSEPKEEIVYELDDSQYTELVSKVDVAVQLLKANRLNIFKIFSDAEQQIRDFSDEKKTGVAQDEKAIMRLRDEQITSLVQKIQGNQKTLENYIQTQVDNREEIQEQFDQIQTRMDTFMEDREKSISTNRKILDSIKKTLGRLVKTSSELKKKSEQALKPASAKVERTRTSTGNTIVQVVTKPKPTQQRKSVAQQTTSSQVLAKPSIRSEQDLLISSSSMEKRRSSVSMQIFSGVLSNPRVLETSKSSVSPLSSQYSTQTSMKQSHAMSATFDGIGQVSVPMLSGKASQKPISSSFPASVLQRPVLPLAQNVSSRSQIFSKNQVDVSGSIASRAVAYSPSRTVASPTRGFPIRQTAPRFTGRRPAIPQAIPVSSVPRQPGGKTIASKGLMYGKVGGGFASRQAHGQVGGPGRRGKASISPSLMHGTNAPVKSGTVQWKKAKKKPTVGQRFKGFVGRTSQNPVIKIVHVKDKVKGAISRSPVGQAVRAVKKVVRAIGKIIKVVTKIVKTIVKVVAKTVKVMWKIAKFAAKSFVTASKVVGKTVKGAVVGTARGIKRFVNIVKKRGIVRALSNLTGAGLVTKLGWGAIKWTARTLWTWIKKAGISLKETFRRIFKLKGTYQNKTEFYLGYLLHGLRDKAYRFIAKPIAGILQAVFAFVGPLIMSPIRFMQATIPGILERFRNVMRDIRSASEDLYKSTWNIFKKILFNPITIALLVGALVYFFWPKLVTWFQDGLLGLGKNIIGTVAKVVSKVWDFAKNVWDAIVSIAKPIADFVTWITDPNGWIWITIKTIVKTIQDIKSSIKKVMKYAGYDSLDFVCMWLAGDFIGMAFAMIEALCVKFWQWISNLPIVRKVIAMIKGLVKAKKIIADLPGVMWDSFCGVWKNVFTGKWNKVIDEAVSPWKDWWTTLTNSVEKNMPYDEHYEANRIKIYESASESSKKTKQNVAIASRSLKMKGMYSQANIKYMDSISQMSNSIANKSILSRIEHMSKLYMDNVEGVENYQQFIQDVWQEGSASDEHAALTIKTLLESPVLSQRLMTPFFYYNPQSGEVMSMRPAEYIGQFIENIRTLVGTNENRDNINVLKQIVMAFDQMNEEKWIVVDRQGQIINDFLNQVYRLNINNRSTGEHDKMVLRDLAQKFNQGDMFSSIRIQQSFEQFQMGDSATSNLTSKATGEKFGTSSLLKIKQRHGTSSDRKVPIENSTRSSYVVKMPNEKGSGESKPPSSRGQTDFGNIHIGPDISPFDSDDTIQKQKASREQMYQKFKAYEDKRQKLIGELGSVDKAAKQGYYYMTFEDFIKRYDKETKTIEEQQKEKAMSEQERTKKLAGLRIVKGIQEWQNQGKDVTGDENLVSINGEDPHAIWNIHTNGIEQNLYLFSPEWKRIIAGMKTKDDVLLKKLQEGGVNLQKYLGVGPGDSKNVEEWGQSEDKSETEDERLAREEREQKQREKEVLDYGAKIKDGYIEVKIDEDRDEIERAWRENQKLYFDLSKKIPVADITKRTGVRSYGTYDEWVKHWRQMHGQPLDGIKRYKFTGKSVQHKVDFSQRKALSADELTKHGIQVSETGPVMIPIDKAMEIAKSLFATAETVYSVRDGLEVMKMGIDHENEELKKRNKEGPEVAAVGIPAPVGQNGVYVQGTEQQAQPQAQAS